MEKQEQCKNCKKPRGKSTHDKLCAKCLKSLPQCKACGIVCGAKEWGYHVEEEAIPCILKKNDEKIILCGSCNRERLTGKQLILDRNVKIPAEEIEIISARPNQ